MSSTTTSPTPAPRKAFRSTDDRLLGGVAAGLAVPLGVDVIYVRAAFLLSAALGGFGAAAYAGLWLVLPTDTHLEISTPGLEAATRQGKRPGRSRRLEDVGLLVAFGAVAIGIAVLGQALFGGSVVFWPILLGVIGLALLWRQADEAQRERWVDSTGRIDFFRAVVGSGGTASWARLAVGAGAVRAADRDVGSGQRGPRRRRRRRPRRRRAGPDGRALVVPARRRPVGGARRPGPLARARRH